jgi:hypothetical protein
VEERHRTQQPVVGAKSRAPGDEPGVVDRAVVRDDGAFRRARGPARELDLKGVA